MKKSYFKNNSTRGQAALEFMMTYGWAILVVLAAIGALSYFGVLNPSRFTPDTCLASAPFSCPGKPIVYGSTSVNANTAVFSLVNGQGFTVSLSNTLGPTSAVGVNLTGTLAGCTTVRVCTQGTTGCASGAYATAAGQGATVNVSGCNFANTNIVKGDVIFTYSNPESQLTEQILISVTAKPR